jgi:hypothetical protein
MGSSPPAVPIGAALCISTIAGCVRSLNHISPAHNTTTTAVVQPHVQTGEYVDT